MMQSGQTDYFRKREEINSKLEAAVRKYRDKYLKKEIESLINIYDEISQPQC